MFNRATALMLGVVLFITVTFVGLTISSRDLLSGNGFQRLAVYIVAPFQSLVSGFYFRSLDFWQIYFTSVSKAAGMDELKKELALAMAAQNRCREIELENERLRRFMEFSHSSERPFVAARVIGRDPSLWSKTIMINKGMKDGISKGLPVVVSEGIVGQVVNAFDAYSRVLLIIDRTSAVDALVQSSRARGIVQGDNSDICIFKYALRKESVVPGDVIVSSGLDQVFPKGLRIGAVVDVKKDSSDLFQAIYLKTFVDFDKLEEVIVPREPFFSVHGENSEFDPDIPSDRGLPYFHGEKLPDGE
ncbi:MAG: rod shape-determining protein MreC [Desulfamplus sp.]|nr:rod shape-determining protein MreC [Desulfamplus sp.]